VRSAVFGYHPRPVILLLTNDDGVDSPGLRALEAAVEGLGEVWTVAPATEQSAKSHALTMHEPLRVARLGPRRFSVTGTPADCVYLAIHHLLPSRPGLVLSGINRGSNLATDVYYSGTVAAAREASTMDLPAIAASLWVRPGGDPNWQTAGAIVHRVAAEVLANGLPPGMLLNVNVPDVPVAEVRGLRVAPLGRRYYQPLVSHQTDPRGRPYFWIGGDHDRFADRPETDGPLCEAGWAVVSPMELDPTAHRFLSPLVAWGLDDTHPAPERLR
jgi:5'-nucleotidase